MRNSLEHNESLFNATRCKFFFYTSPFEDLASKIEALGLKSFRIPSYDEMLQASPKPYEYTRTLEAAMEDIAFYTHTSGSTGPPRPIPHFHKTLCKLDKQRFVTAPQGRKPNIFNSEMMGEKDGDRYICGFPVFHMTGVYAGVHTLMDFRVQVRGPTDAPLTGRTVTEIMGEMEISAIYAPPTIFDDILKNHSTDFRLRAEKTKMAVFAGGGIRLLFNFENC